MNDKLYIVISNCHRGWRCEHCYELGTIVRFVEDDGSDEMLFVAIEGSSTPGLKQYVHWLDLAEVG